MQTDGTTHTDRSLLATDGVSAADTLSDSVTRRYRRVRELFIGAELLLVVTIITNTSMLSEGRRLSTTIIFTGMLAIVCTLHATFHSGREAWSLRYALWMTTSLVTLAIWTDRGLEDMALLAYGIVLIYAAILETRRQYFMHLACILMSIAAIGIVHGTGISPFRQATFQWMDVIDAMMIYTLLGYCIDGLSQDLRTMIERYREETEKLKRSEAEVSRLVHHDALTGLPNRIILQQLFENFVLTGAGRVAVLFVDLDNFKTVNDTLGHAAGDRLLMAIAEALTASVGPRAVTGRIGGDEFLIVAPLGAGEDPVELATRVQQAAARPVTIDGKSLSPTFSTGVAVAPDNGLDFDTLRRKADIALYSAKAAGRNIHRIYEDGMGAEAMGVLQMVSRLQMALERGEFRLHYQPQLNLATGRLRGVEALLRWYSPEGMVMPDAFIPTAESTGLINDIGRWVLIEACRQCRAWQLSAFPGLTISVNISALQLKRGNLEEIVTEALATSGLRPEHLELEITESQIIEDGYDIGGQIDRIASTGVTFALDDFGKGCANLGSLVAFDFRTLKIDRQFVQAMLSGEKDRALMASIIGMARALGLETVAEGVESLEALETLRALGCDTMQGMIYAAALPADQFIPAAMGGPPFAVADERPQERCAASL